MNKEIIETKIHEGYEARIEGNKIILERKESEDERIRKRVIEQMELWHECALENNAVQDIKDSADAITYLEKLKEQNPKVECDIAQPVEQDGTDEPNYGMCGDSVPGKLAAALRRHGWHLGHVGENQQMVEARKEEVMRNWPADRYSLTQKPKQEQPMPDSTKLIELWHEDKEMLKEKDFRDDPWRLAYNAFMCGFGRGIAVNKQEQTEVNLEKFTDKIKTFQKRYKHPEIVSIKGAMAFMARMFYQYPNAARQWYDRLPKTTMD